MDDRFFSDPDLNDRALDIKFKIDSLTDINKIERLISNGILIAKQLLDETQFNREYIKERVGASNETYIEISDAIALASAGCVKFQVSFMMTLSSANDFHRSPSIKDEVKKNLIEANRVMSYVSFLPMKFKSRQLINQVNQLITQAEKRVSGGNSGCFIATYVYGAYDAKEVLALRHFRDSFINRLPLGSLIIHIYYVVSPWLISLLSKIPWGRSMVKKILDVFVNQIIKTL